VTVIPEKVPDISVATSPVPRDSEENNRRDEILKEGEEFLKDSILEVLEGC
jgi:hypothetical protein